MYRDHKFYKTSLELVDTWRDQNDLADRLLDEEIKRAALPGIQEARLSTSEMVRMICVANGLQPEQSFNPAPSNPTNEVDDESED
jgi:hypothetical protein